MDLPRHEPLVTPTADEMMSPAVSRMVVVRFRRPGWETRMAERLKEVDSEVTDFERFRVIPNFSDVDATLTRR